MTDEEFEIEKQWREVRARYLAAKAAGRDTDEYREAKKAMGDLRAFWRGIRDVCTPGTEGVATPATIEATTGVNKKGG